MGTELVYKQKGEKGIAWIMKSRLRTQSRLSGNKTWLPLRFIGKIDSKLRKNYVDKIYEELKIIIIDGNSYEHKPVYKIDKLILSPNDNGSYDVYCIYEGKRYRVGTPIGYLNKKEQMRVNDVNDIVIDHVTPIDTTLSNLKLSELDKVSKIVKEVKNYSGKKGNALESEAYSFYIKGKKEIDINILQNDLYNIIKDSHYRLVSASMNSKKSNLIDYKEIYKVNDDYYAKIADINKDDDVVFQNLKNDFMESMKKSDFENLKKGKKPLRLVDVPIKLL